MTDQEANFSLGKTVSLALIRETIVGFSGTNLFHVSDSLLVPLFILLLVSLIASGDFIFTKNVTNQLLWWKISVVQQDTICSRQEYGD